MTKHRPTMHTTNPPHQAARTLLAGTMALQVVACVNNPTSTFVRVPATELPIIAPNTLANTPPPTNVRTTEGSVNTLYGPVGSVELTVKQQAVPITLPFKARIQGVDLEILTDQVRMYPLADISYAKVETLSEARNRVALPVRYGVGTGMIVVAVPFFVIGTIGVLSDVGCSPGGFLNFCGLNTLVGLSFGLVGAGLLIPGVLLRKSAIETPKPKMPPMKTTFVRPSWRVSPTGVSFSAEF